MFRGKPSNRGQVLIIFVFAIIGLIAMVGLAVDGGNIYSDRRQAQNAADTAALAAGVTRVNWEKISQALCNNFNTETHTLPSCSTTPVTGWPAIIDSALNAASTNGYTDDKVSSTVNVYSPPKDGAYSDCTQSTFDCHDYVEVIIQSNVNTFFARVLGIGQLHNMVEAVALSKYSPTTSIYGTNSLVELGTGVGKCPSDFDVGGSGTITLTGGGIYVNSTNPTCAYKQTSCNASLVLAGGATIQVAPGGGYDTNKCASPTINPGPTHYAFPPDHLLNPPPECATTGTFTSSGTTTTYQQGNYYGYSKFPVNNDNGVLSPGVYCVNDLNNFQNGQSLTGSGVMIYLRPTGQVTISGGDVTLSPPGSGTYAGYLIYQDWNSTSTVQNCKIVGSAGSQYTGLIFVPYCDMNIAGSSGTNGFKSEVVAFTIQLSGTNNLYFTYDSSVIPKIPEKVWTGLYH